MADYTPVYVSGNNPFTKTAGAAITGGQVLDATGASTVQPSGAASTAVVGVAAHDAASGARVTVWPLANVEHELTVVGGGSLVVGAGVITGAAGTVNTAAVATAAAAGTLIGVATTAAAAGAKGRFVGRG